MPHFLYQAAYTPEAWAAQLRHPDNRPEKIGTAMAEAFGGKLVGAWYCFGEYDVAVILDVPNAEAMASIALALAAGGALKSAQTTVLMSGHEAVAAMKKASSLNYKPPHK